MNTDKNVVSFGKDPAFADVVRDLARWLDDMSHFMAVTKRE